jgi:hypothetical protein
VGRQQSEDAYAVRCSHIDFTVGDEGSDELVARAEVIASVSGLVGVVEFLQVPWSKWFSLGSLGWAVGTLASNWTSRAGDYSKARRALRNG